MIVVLVNPRSRANRRNPRIASEFQALVAGVGRVVTPRSLEELDREMAALRAKPPTLIAVHGGDGTLHREVTALGRGFGDDPIPPLAILGGGTMNVVASSLRIKQPTLAFLTALAADARAGRAPETLRRRCIRLGEQLGFIFGNGLMANFLGEYYGTGKYG